MLFSPVIWLGLSCPVSSSVAQNQLFWCSSTTQPWPPFSHPPQRRTHISSFSCSLSLYLIGCHYCPIKLFKGFMVNSKGVGRVKYFFRTNDKVWPWAHQLSSFGLFRRPLELDLTWVAGLTPLRFCLRDASIQPSPQLVVLIPHPVWGWRKMNKETT